MGVAGTAGSGRLASGGAAADRMADHQLQLVQNWIEAYYTHRDEDLRALAHPDIEIRPRAGHGERLYTGLDGVDRWLADAGPERSPVTAYSVGMLGDGRVLAEATIGDIPVVALYELRDERIATVSMFVSDRDLLQRIGAIERPPARVITRQIDAPGARDRRAEPAWPTVPKRSPNATLPSGGGPR